MPKRIIDLRSQAPLLDIVSYARGREPLTPAQRAYVARTVRRVPEVVVKVSGGARTLAGVERHLKYMEKKGVSGLETDMDTIAGGSGFARELAIDWDLDIESVKHYSKKAIRGKPPKLVHNIIFSMPVGTSPKKVLEAVRRLALNEWSFEHRYAMALHTDTPRPHVHVVVKSVSEKGVRLNIKKATLRQWRAQFAQNLRDLGVAANATERAVRGETRAPKRTSIFRADRRDDSSRMRKRQDVALHLPRGSEENPDVGHSVMTRTRLYVASGWRVLAARLRTSGDDMLARDIDAFVDGMPPVRTETAMLAEHLRSARHREGAPERSH